MLRQCPKGHWTAEHVTAECHECKRSSGTTTKRTIAAVAVATVALGLPATSFAAKPNPIAHSGHQVKVHICPIAHSGNWRVT